MFKLTRILVPVEFSPRCQGAVHYAEALADRFHAEIILLHVIPPPVPHISAMEAMAYTPEDLTRELIAARTQELAGFPCETQDANSVRRTVMEGDPARTIVEQAISEHCDLIVMPTHGYGPFRRFLLGSVTAKVLHDADCPVWTGPHLEQAPPRDAIAFRQVVCAIDLGPHSRDVLRYAGSFACAAGAALTIVHAVPVWTTSMGGFYFDPDWDVQLANAARDSIECLLRNLNVHAGIVVQSGDTPVAVRDAACTAGADLIVIGRGSTPRAHGHLPTNSYAIVRESPCAVAAL